MHKRYSLVLVIVAMLIATGFLATMDKVNAASPTIYVDPANIIGDLNPAPGSVTTVNIKASNIPSPGLWGDEFYLALDKNVFPEQVPITNMNFTTNINGWTTTTSGTPTGVQTVQWDSADGNPSPGSGVGSFMHRINGTGSVIGSVTYYSEFSFNWPMSGDLPQDGVQLSFAYRIKGNSIAATSGITIRVQFVKPGGTTYTPKLKTYSSPYPTGWFYNFTSLAGNQFTLTGTYKLRLVTILKTAGIATTDYAQVNWDDVGLRMAPVVATEGSFLKQQPPVVPITNMNFTSDTSSWTIGQTGTGTPTSGFDGADGNPNPPGSGVGSLKLRATSTAGATANLEFTVSQSFSWSSGQPLFAYFSYAFNSIGNSYFPTESTKSATTNAGAWTNPADAYTSNNVYASSGTDAQQHVYGGYGFDSSIPAGVTITKVEVGVEAYTSGNWGINTTVSWDGGATYYPFPSPNLLQTSDPNAVLWNDVTSWTSWSATKLLDANFKVKILTWKPQGGAAATVYLDWLPVKVTWKSSSVDVRIVKPDSSVISLLNSISLNSTKSWAYSRGNIISPTVFSTSGTYQIQLVTNLMTNAVGTGNYVQVNWDDVGVMLLISGGSSSTYFTSIFKRYATNNTLYCAYTMTGTPMVTSIPVIGGGTLATVKILVGYGAANLDLYNTMLTTIGDPPNYPPIPLAHTAVDGFFRNKITGDIDGDRDVDQFDFGLFAPSYGSLLGQPAYNREADLDYDGDVDQFDFGLFAPNYGRSV